MANTGSYMYNQTPNIDIKRNKFYRPYSTLFNANCGELVAFYCEKVLPGDTFDIKHDIVIRLMHPLWSTMDYIHCYTAYFFVPFKLLWDRFYEFFGENKTGSWAQTEDINMPHLFESIPSSGNPADGLLTTADGLKCPINDMGLAGFKDMRFSFQRFPTQAVALIWNEWFRNQNLQDPALITTDDSDLDVNNRTGDYRNDLQLGVMRPKVNQMKDYFTSMLPAPQKGASVLLPLGISAPVSISMPLRTDNVFTSTTNDTSAQPPLVMKLANQTNNFMATGRTLGTTNILGQIQQVEVTQTPTTTPLPVTPANLRVTTGGYNLTGTADLTQATAASVNDVRLAFQLQRVLERDAISGTRYPEFVLAHFGVQLNDVRGLRPEYLGGNRSEINISQVLATDSNGELGIPGGYSLSDNHLRGISKSFDEHGVVIGCMWLKHDIRYTQGTPREWTGRSRYDEYHPALAHIGEQAVRSRELLWNPTSLANNSVIIGYVPAWEEYRKKMWRACNDFSPGLEFDSWSYAKYFQPETIPVLNSAFVEQDRVWVDKTMANGGARYQFLCEAYVQNRAIRPLPRFGIPGLIDHF